MLACAFVGAFVSAVGNDDGDTVGLAVGLSVGIALGTTDGLPVGVSVLSQHALNTPLVAGQHNVPLGKFRLWQRQ